MKKHDEAALKILKFALTLKLQEPIAPVADTAALTGFSYPQLKDILGDLSSSDIMLLKKLESSGYLTGTLRDKVLLCPYCLAYNIIFRDTCPECGSPNIEAVQMIHHYRCGFVGEDREFLSDGNMICPKCMQKLIHIGKDYEKPSEVYNCLECRWSGSETLTTGRCLACDSKIEKDNYIICDIKSYTISQEGTLAAGTGDIRLMNNENEKLPSKEEIKNLPWTIPLLLSVTDILIMIAERYTMNISVMAIFPDALSDIQNKFNKRNSNSSNIANRLIFNTTTVMDEKALGLINSILEKIRTIIRHCDYAAISGHTTLSILLPEASKEQAVMFAGRISAEVNSLLFSGPFKQTNLSIGISGWRRGLEARDLLQQAIWAMEKARYDGGNQIVTYNSEMDSDKSL